ncbi:acyl-CoA dehydrogenase, partial [Xanthomonas sp. Kuri4-1]
MNARALAPSPPPPARAPDVPATPSDAALAERFDPVFARIAEGAVARERERRLAHEPVAWLRAA